MAWECEEGSLHLNSDWLILEAVDKNYQPVPDGQMSHTSLITNLANRVQPIIRYELGDSIRFHVSPCSCGSPFPGIDVLGRQDSVIEVMDDHGDLIHLLPLALTTAIEEGAGVFDFQIFCNNKSTLTLRLPPRSKSAGKDMHQCIDALATFLKVQGASKVRIIEEANAPIKPGRTGKCKRVLI